jgi:uncharacterized membrane protein YkvA (DUF1232 family)
MKYSSKYNGNDIDNLNEDTNDNDLSDLESHVIKASDKKSVLEKNHYNSDILKNIVALSKYILDKDVKWYKKSIVITALAYFVKPEKALPNWNEFFEFLDDVGAIEWTVKFIGRELDKYY